MAAATGAIQLTRTMRAVLGAVAAGTTQEVSVGRNDLGGVATVTAVRWIPNATLTGANTNTRAISVSRRTAGGAATQVANTQFNAGVNATAYAGTNLALSGTAANLDVPAGDIITATSTAVGTGLADPGGAIEIDLQRA